MKNLPLDVHPPGLHYHRLEKHQFRIINVLEGDDDDLLDITVMLINYSDLDTDDKTYAPVSYRWQADEAQVPVRIQGAIATIPRGLAHLMRLVRHPKGSGLMKTMWIDQLCINQDDDDDKAQQIPLMRGIFERTAGVLVWLGDNDTAEWDLAFALIDRWMRLRDDPDRNAGPYLDHLSFEDALGPPTAENLKAYRALRSLLRYDYWDRTWVLQEATSHFNTHIVYGDIKVTQENVIGLHRVFYARNQVMFFVARNAPAIYGLQDTPSARVGRLENFGIMRREDSHPLFKLLNHVRRTNCSDQRDKIFSVLAFASDVGDYVHDRFLQPSYDRDAAALYVDVARWYLCHKQTLDLIGYCCSRQDERQPGSPLLPSWVPNWSNATYMLPMPKTAYVSADDEQEQPAFSACGPHSHVSPLVAPPADGWQTNTLFVSGIRIATICKVLEPALDLFLSLDTEKSWQPSFEPTAAYPLSDCHETMLDAFEKTLTLDCQEHAPGSEKCRRGGRVAWPDEANTATRMDQTRFIKHVTRRRRLFYAHSDKHFSPEDALPIGADGRSLIMGLGRDDIRVGDMLWAVKGGSVLYILRYLGQMLKKSWPDPDASSEPATHLHLPDQLWFNGRRREGTAFHCSTFQIVGEAYAHGLMDGQVLEYAARPPAQRPEVLRDMQAEFEDVLLGGAYWVSKRAVQSVPGVGLYDVLPDAPEASETPSETAAPDACADIPEKPSADLPEQPSMDPPEQTRITLPEQPSSPLPEHPSPEQGGSTTADPPTREGDAQTSSSGTFSVLMTNDFQNLYHEKEDEIMRRGEWVFW